MLWMYVLSNDWTSLCGFRVLLNNSELVIEAGTRTISTSTKVYICCVVHLHPIDSSLDAEQRPPSKTRNHEESVDMMHELEDATGIEALTFQSGMRNAREKLQWVSTHVTTVPGDIVDSLSRTFGVYIPVIHGENHQHALGRLLQEIVAQSGDIAALEWVGQPSEFNSCLSADVASYAAPPHVLPSVSEDDIEIAISCLQNDVAASLAMRLYTLLENVSAPRFAHCRFHLPCITFHVTEVRRRAQETRFTYGVKAEGLCDLVITTEQTLVQFSRARPTRQTFLLVLPWDRRLLELPDFADDAESLGDWSEHEALLDDSDESPGTSPVRQELADLESHSRALRLIVRLGQPFSALLLAQQRSGEYKRIASDHGIVAQVKDVLSVMNVGTLEIL